MILYRLLVSLFAAALSLRALRTSGATGGAAELRARLSTGRPARAAPHIWLHGASNGELASVRPLLVQLNTARPDMHWLITANTRTGQHLAEDWGMPRTTVRLAPVDLQHVTRRVMRDWHVKAHIVLESELWPNRMLSCPGPNILLGARMSKGSARTWARMPRLAHRVLSRVSYASAQDPQSATRLLDLGIPPKVMGPVLDLKAFYHPEAPGPDPALDAALPRGTTWLAASTHDGDEDIVLAAHARLVDADPQQRLVIAPRHPRRAETIAALAQHHGLSIARRSLGQAPDSAQVYLADTLGEMPLWYARAGRVFIGGTLSDRGGHTPYEPAAFGAALLHGPDTGNFTTAFDRLRAARASDEIHDARSLAKALQALHDPARQVERGTAAAQALRQETDLDAVLAAILRVLPPPDAT